MKKTSQFHMRVTGFLMLVLVCMLCLFGIKAEATEIKTYGKYQYCYNEEYNGIEIVKYEGKTKTVKVPKKIEGIPVKVIGDRAFEYNETITKIVLPESVRVIGKEAFEECVNLKKINLPKKLQLLGKEAFLYCEKLSNIQIPKTLKKIPDGAFYGTGLKEIIIPKNIEEIDDYAFGDLRQMRKLTFAKKSKLKRIGKNAFLSCHVLEEVKLPASLEEIDTEAFQFCKHLRKVKFEKNCKITKINRMSFGVCYALQTIEIPEKVKVIHKEAFVGCKWINNIIFKGAVPTSGIKAFEAVREDAIFKVPSKYKAKYEKKLKRQKWFKSTMKVV